MPTIMLETKVGEVMSKAPASIDQGLKVDVAIELMQQRGIRRLPVVGGSDQQLVGIVTLEDARRVMPAGTPFYGAGQAAQAEIPDVRRAMSSRVVTIGPEDSLAMAAQLMVHHKIGALPVLEQGAIVGIITESDIFKFVARGLPPLQTESDFG